MEWQEKYALWLKQAETDAALKTLMNETPQSELSDCFHGELEFGTGGLRAIMGAGTNRMNVYTVNRASRGLAAYLKAHGDTPSCAVAYDSRLNSRVFAETAAKSFLKCGVKAFIFQSLAPTPLLSFAVRHLHTDAGIVITASHNSAQYNGYKVYGADGCQITPEAAKEISAYIDKEPYFAPFDGKSADIPTIGESVYEAFYEAVLKTGLLSPAVRVKVAYSPLNGTGLIPVTEILQRAGNTEVAVVSEQEQPNGNFPTCRKPNPELPETMALVMSVGRKENADVCIATDPDADRLGVAVPNGDTMSLFTGNEIGLILFDFICKLRVQNGTMPKNLVAVKTIVTAETAEKIAAKYGVKLINVLTGFKFIGEQITLLGEESARFVFGFEESCGYLAGDYARDKDAIGASLLTVQAVSYYKSMGQTLTDVLKKIYAEHGYEKTKLLDFAFAGEAGAAKIKRLMAAFRKRDPVFFSGFPADSFTDYLNDVTGLPKSDVLKFAGGGLTVTVRPSGTEPKLKIYLSAICENEAAAQCEIDGLSNAVTKVIDAAVSPL